MSLYSFDSFYRGSLVLTRKTDRHVDKTAAGTKFFVNNSGWGSCFFMVTSISFHKNNTWFLI